VDSDKAKANKAIEKAKYRSIPISCEVRWLLSKLLKPQQPPKTEELAHLIRNVSNGKTT